MTIPSYSARFKDTLVSMVWPEITGSVRVLHRCERYSSEDVIALQLQKLNALLQHFHGIDVVHQDFTARGVSDWQLNSLRDLEKFPVVTKAMLRSYERELASSPFAYRKGSTSGSTGRNFTFYQSRSMVRARTAAVRYCYHCIGIDYWADSKTIIWGRAPHSSLRTRLNIAAKKAFLNTRSFSAFGLDDATALSYLRVISTTRPTLVEGYPSYLFTLATVGLASGGSTLRHSPRAVVTSGEQLYDHQRTTIEEWFGAPVFNRYGSREFGVIAHERPGMTGLWIPPTRFIIEETEDGELLVTDLDNYGFPFIRYAIGDCARVDSPSGHQSITDLLGRSHDVIRTPSGRMLPGQFWTLIARSVPGIEEFQVVQTDPARIELRVVANPLFGDDEESRLRAGVHEVAGGEIEFVVHRVPNIVPTPSGKRRFVIARDG